MNFGFIIILLSFYFSYTSSAANLNDHPVRKDQFWRSVKSKSLQDKLDATIPNEVIDYLIQDNKAQGWPNIPKAAHVPADFLSDVKKAIAEIPESIQKKINEKLLGLFFVTDLGGSAYTEFVTDKDGKESAGFTILDISALNKKANEWATWKESSPFSFSKGDRLVATIAYAGNNHRANALQYILLHEFGHIVSIGSPLLPAWGSDPSNLKLTNAMEFFNLSWLVNNDRIVSKFDEMWKERTQIHYYAAETKKVSGDQSLSVYEGLVRTGFPTLYAATNPSDDFAESFANYIHVIKLKKPWTISIKTGKKQMTVQSCWSQSRCREKGAVIERILQ